MGYKENIKSLVLNISTKESGLQLNTQLIEKYKEEIKDKEYFNFISNYSNGGFFLDSSLQFYGFTIEQDYRNIETVNNIFLKEYDIYSAGLRTIGQDVFGNQFVYDLYTQHIFLFNIETADKEKLGEDFATFIEKLYTDIEYYSGRKFLLNYTNTITLNQRLCPKKPFTIGGEYKNENFYACNFPSYFEFFADIARQIHELPNGTPIKIKIVE